MKPIKIGFLGTHGTGKTTATFELAAALKKQSKNVSTIMNTARSCPLEINEKGTVNSQFWIFGELLRREQESYGDIVICDRTLLDMFAYLRRISKYVADDLRPFIKNYMCTYSAIFYMSPREGYLIDDGRRSVNKNFQIEIKNIINREIRRMKVDVIKGTTQNERVSIVMGLLNNVKTLKK